MTVTPGTGNKADNEQTYQRCPRCGTTIPVHQGFVTWCDNCNWNLSPHESAYPASPFEGLYFELSSRLDKKQLDHLANEPIPRAKLTPSKLIALFISLAVHSLTFIFAFIGVNMIWQTWFNPIPFMVGVTLLAVAWVSRPYIPNLSREQRENLITRNEFPTLYDLADKIGHALGSNRKTQIVLDDTFRANYLNIGWKRTNVIFLGLALFSILEPQEQVALLALELAHGVNGNGAGNFLIFSAIGTLDGWYRILNRNQIVEPNDGILRILSNVISGGMAQIVRVALIALIRLTFREMQRSEYLADGLSAEIAGTEAMLGLIRKLHMHETVLTTVRHFYLNNVKANLFDALRTQIANVPARELARIELVERLSESRLNAACPPTAHRLDLLNMKRFSQPNVRLSAQEQDKIVKELAQAEPRLQAHLVDTLADQSYY